MIDLDEMEKFSRSMIERGIGNMEPGASCYETVELINRLRQAEKVASRYYWLRDHACIEDIEEFYNSFRHNRDSLMDNLMNV